MTVLSPATWAQYGSYDARNDRLHVSSLLSTEGATSPSGFAATQQVVASMKLTIGAGSAYINAPWAINQGYYCFINDAPIDIDVQPSDPTYPRIDRVIARVYDAFYEGTENKAQIEIKKGDPAVSPEVPAIPSGSIELARISVAAGATTIVTANINNSVMPLASFNGSLLQQGLASAWVPYTPAYTNLTVGAGTNSGRYKIIGKTAFVIGYWTFGAGAAVGTNPQTTLPIPTASGIYANGVTLGSVSLYDASATLQVGWARWLSTTQAQLMPNTGTGITATAPWTWTTGDTISWNLTYEIA